MKPSHSFRAVSDARDIHTPKDTVSYRIQYNSELLLQINSLCKPKLSKKQAISISKILNFERIKNDKALQ